MAKELIPINYDCIDILEDEMYDELVWDYCEKVCKREDYSDAESFMQNVLAIEYFPDVTFHSLLQQYFEEKGEDIEEKVRGYVKYKQGFLMTHGIGYSWESADLFGGSADGRAKPEFERWLEEKGFTLSRGENW